MGSDSLLQFATWREPEVILELAGLAVAPRPGDDREAVAAAVRAGGRSGCTLLDMPPLGISSTDVRRRVREGLPIRYLVPAAVEDLIREPAPVPRAVIDRGEAERAAGGAPVAEAAGAHAPGRRRGRVAGPAVRRVRA